MEEDKRPEGLSFLRGQSNCSNPVCQVMIDGRSGGVQVLGINRFQCTFSEMVSYV